MEYLFSIIVPHYNSCKYLKKLLESIPIENDIQLIIVDDKSTEDIKEIRKSVNIRNGIFLSNQTSKKSAGTCRNIGLNQASGKWIIFADADDYFVDNAFEIMRKYKDSDADLIYFMPTSRYLDTNILAERHLRHVRLIKKYCDKRDVTTENQMKYGFIECWSKMYKRELIIDNGILFDETIVANDVMFSAKVGYMAKQISVSDEIVYCVTKSEGTLTTSINNEYLFERVNVEINRFHFLKEKLEKKEFENLKRSGKLLLLKCLHEGYGLNNFVKVYWLFRKNNVTIFKLSYLKHDLDCLIEYIEKSYWERKKID